tara:strand:- start:535 stop:702 length:168 start_codon:yes stop_codon:yes gene_type:complete
MKSLPKMARADDYFFSHYNRFGGGSGGAFLCGAVAAIFQGLRGPQIYDLNKTSKK